MHPVGVDAPTPGALIMADSKVTREQIEAQLRHAVQAGTGYPTAQATLLAQIDAYVLQCRREERTKVVDMLRKEQSYSTQPQYDCIGQLILEVNRLPD